MKFLLGKKLGMTTLQDLKQGALNVTLIEVPENKISLLRNFERDGYAAVQVIIPKTRKRIFRKEFRIDPLNLDRTEALKKLESFKDTEVLDISLFTVGDRVSVSGTTKAKGFQGVVKRHGFKGAPKSHGHKHDLRAPGSIGAVWPQHVIKGMRMGGRMGGIRSTSMNVQVVYVDAEKRLIGVQGAVPGIAGGVVEIRTKQ